MIKLEICCYSINCAVIAQKAGADRIELSTSPSEGGGTPSFGTLQQALQQLSIPVHPIVRPRGGDFCYSNTDFEVMKNDVAHIRDMGFPGIVFGVLNEEGHIDRLRMRQLMSLSGNMEVTFHRAFDMCFNPHTALQQLTELGVKRILTSGQQQNAEIGLPLLKELIQASQGPIIMPGAGIRVSNISKFLEWGMTEVHSSAGKLEPSSMKYRKAGVTMSSDDRDVDEYSHYCIDGQLVESMKDVISLIQQKK
ncbi:copper homeostasis protein CutC [Xenorhabdus nematophila]|uniref:PF03932 family protein CutC n=1 Tax=Xenorhabdus nematophila (strain ATCC 19061 / DSM 3370 / CCUG 14189 / LMG 1036 / NCIMB 9965 / AN6) TaxID=406817 RepID=D3VET9_XENNA|nr:copper homeostasis protein CutC [Xenorhabdus nematophila]CEE94613.1 copper homeostasis protein [Xenorhabdus nematophila str. Anatoliense]CEF30391.1 copper homeostasis protein [Xenorhabdus nematophila str. Websteri]AYA40312.1 copper homeostasis protein CutC [Xenorhabdus nematophila]KHD28755.1 copper homeostasis protein CutC [Xenorhabdus nematophila]MBA0018983.1 copper homeostasis protein CutC [Xenorhabdus nematophila]